MFKHPTYFLLVLLTTLLVAACSPVMPEAVLAAPENQANASSKIEPAELQQPTLNPENAPTAAETSETAKHIVITPEKSAPSIQRSRAMTDTHSIEEPYSEASEKNQVVASVVEKLAVLLSVPRENIEILSIRSALWRNSNMGCPTPGGKAAQVLIPGYVIILEVDGTTFTYHTDDTGRRAVLCQPAGRGAAPTKTGKPPEASVLAARQLLAQTLNIAIEQVLFVFAEPLSCPDQDGGNVPEGWRLALYYQGKRYIYRVCGPQITPLLPMD